MSYPQKLWIPYVHWRSSTWHYSGLSSPKTCKNTIWHFPTTLEAGSDRFFLSINRKGKSISHFFTRVPLGNNIFQSILKRVFQSENVLQTWSNNFLVTYSLHGTLETIFYESGHSDSSVAIRTGHRNSISLKSYQNLSCGKGCRQKRDFLGDVGGTSENIFTSIYVQTSTGGADASNAPKNLIRRIKQILIWIHITAYQLETRMTLLLLI